MGACERGGSGARERRAAEDRSIAGRVWGEVAEARVARRLGTHLVRKFCAIHSPSAPCLGASWSSFLAQKGGRRIGVIWKNSVKIEIICMPMSATSTNAKMAGFCRIEWRTTYTSNAPSVDQKTVRWPSVSHRAHL